MLFVKIPPKDITHYSVYYCNISLAFKTATKSIENLLRTFQTTYNSEFTDKKRIFESNIINTKGFDDKKSFWLLNGIIACSIALILLCGKLYIIIARGRGGPLFWTVGVPGIPVRGPATDDYRMITGTSDATVG